MWINERSFSIFINLPAHADKSNRVKKTTSLINVPAEICRFRFAGEIIKEADAIFRRAGRRNAHRREGGNEKKRERGERRGRVSA